MMPKVPGYSWRQEIVRRHNAACQALGISSRLEVIGGGWFRHSVEIAGRRFVSGYRRAKAEREVEIRERQLARMRGEG